jgi:Photosynthetic reaction centre cytochrome C subunit
VSFDCAVRKGSASPLGTSVGNADPAMKRSSLGVSTYSAALLTGAALILTTAAQAPQGSRAISGGLPPQARIFPVPKNLKVLPKEMTGEQVHTLMVQWAASLGVQCIACHAEDLETTGLDGRPPLNFAADSKPMKAVARTMFTMTERINSKYVVNIENSGVPVTCGTCHRGRLEPEPFVPAPSKETSSPRPTLNDNPRSNKESLSQ